ncbi:MAG: chemotaxis protein CheW, partial [Chloroflexi bacterium]|nr:chemotaxis protein CheW [Chloroflexota bacterium]
MAEELETSQSEEMQLVIFDLAGEAYGVAIQAVLEII